MVVTYKRYIGNLGEDIACRFLIGQGFTIKDRNYLKKYGEIDIVAEKDTELHFIEVKSVSHKNSNSPDEQFKYFLPEENIHPQKCKRLSRTIESYLLDEKKGIRGGLDSDWQFDVVIVFLCMDKKTAEVKFLQNIMLA